MIDSASYAHVLHAMTGNDITVQSKVVASLITLAQYAAEKSTVMQSLSLPHLKQLLTNANFPRSVVDLVIFLHHRKQIRLLPKIRVSYERTLERHNVSIARISTAEPISLSIIKRYVDKNTIVVQTTDPSLIRGFRFHTGRATTEMSVADRLNQITAAIRA